MKRKNSSRNYVLFLVVAVATLVPAIFLHDIRQSLDHVLLIWGRFPLPFTVENASIVSTALSFFSRAMFALAAAASFGFNSVENTGKWRYAWGIGFVPQALLFAAHIFHVTEVIFSPTTSPNVVWQWGLITGRFGNLDAIVILSAVAFVVWTCAFYQKQRLVNPEQKVFDALAAQERESINNLMRANQRERPSGNYYHDSATHWHSEDIYQ